MSIYIASLYFLITTLTTAGYGDVVCVSFPERIFQIIELSLGIILYSYIISRIGDYVKTESYATIVYNNNSAILEEIRITYPKMPFKLYNQILHHLQTNFQQQKSSDINVLINSLPHALKSTLLFVINEKYINYFHFFKKCYNSNFIEYSLINFVPISYKKNTLIIKEDQLIDNAIFIKEGRLSLEIAINLEKPEQSIKKYLNKNYNPLKNEDNNNNKFGLSQNLTSTIDILDRKKTDLKELKTFLTQYTIDMKGKGIEFSNIEREFDESNYQFLHISNIFKNEHYGEVFIILNKPSPLFLRVKSKKANLFLLNKKHILHLSGNFPNIWKRLFAKSLKNMKALKQKTIDVVKKYNLSSVIKRKSIHKKSIKEKKKSSKMLSPSSLQKFIEKNINDITRTSNNSEINFFDDFKEDKDDKKEMEHSEEQNNLEKENFNNKGKNKRESNNLNKSISKNKKFRNNIIIKDKYKILNKLSKSYDFNKENKNKKNKERNKSFQRISSKHIIPFYYSLINYNENKIKLKI